MTVVRIGYEVPSGAPVEVPLQHTAIYGLTRQAGKTTALEGMISRLKDTALVIRTGKNDITFDWAHAVRPFFRERVDWHYVERMLWSFLNEKPKVYRTWIMRSTQGARTLEDVHSKLRDAATRKGLRGWDADMLYQLDHYFGELLPALRSLDFSTTLDIARGQVNVMDLENVPKTVQQLIVAAVLDRLMEHPQHVVVVLPEARNFIPSGTATPATRSADDFVREGAKLGMFLWVDSQSLTGVDQQTLRNFGLSLHGRQTSDLEIDRIVKAIGAGVTKASVKKLGLGQFLLEDQDGVRTVYAQPSWLSDGLAIQTAKGTIPVQIVKETREEKVDDKERKAYEDRITMLEERHREQLAVIQKNAEKTIADLRKEVRELEARQQVVDATDRLGGFVPTPLLPPPVPESIGHDPDACARHVGEMVAGERMDIHAQRLEANLTVHEKLVHVDALEEGESVNRFALLIAEGFFDTKRTNSHVRDEMRRRGWGQWIGGGANDQMNDLLQKFCEWRIIDRVEGNKRVDYEVVPAAKERIRVVREAVTA